MGKPNPIGAWLRDTRARRRVGCEAACACGERRPNALLAGRTPPQCFRCERIAQGGDPYDWHHPFGQRNSALTIRLPVNDHRAFFSPRQWDWAEGALENPNDSPLRNGMARFHAFRDMAEDCMVIVETYRRLEEHLTTIYGLDWMTKVEAQAARAKRKAAKGVRKP